MRQVSQTTVLAGLVLVFAAVLPLSMAFSQPADGPTSIVDVAETSDAELRDRMVRFVDRFYLSGQDLSGEEIDTLYAPVVDYFGNTRKTLTEVKQDKIAYFKRWPDRLYELIPETLEIVRSDVDPDVIGVEFEYLFDVRSASRTSMGRGFTVLTLDFSTPGGRITRETGDVIDRKRR